MNRLGRFLVGGVIALVGCGETANTSPSQLNLDRPRDMAFGCFGGMRVTDGRTTGDPADPIVLSAQPTAACDIRSGDRISGMPNPVPPGQEDLTMAGGDSVPGTAWFSFILQSGPGTVAVARFETKPAVNFTGGDVNVLDADPLTPGKNSITIGEDPVAIAIDAAGCKVVTANAGSCDLSVLDIGSAVDQDQTSEIDVQRVDVKNAAGELIRAKPGAMAFEPSIDVIGKACTATAVGIAYIAYPNCHMVAAVDTATGSIVQHVTYDASGVATLVTNGNVTCPDECSGGSTLTPGTRPVTLDLERDARTAERRLVIGADNSSTITVVELDEVTTLPVSLRPITFEDPTAKLGFTQIVLSPVIGMGGAGGIINDMGPGGQFQFVYGVATDHTVRVADIQSLDRECDTQVDPRFLRDIRSVKDLSCLPIDDDLFPRRAGARGPGIQLVGDGVPVSVEVIKSREIDGGSAIVEPAKLIGYFGLITATNGGTFIFNVDDDDFRDLFEPTRPLLAPMPMAIAHQLRDGIPFRDDLARDEATGMTLCDDFGLDDGSGTVVGGPRSTNVPQRNVPVGVYAPEKVNGLPGIRTLRCVGQDSTRLISELGYQAPEEIRDRVFPDLGALRNDELWTLTWEGAISNDRSETDIDGPQIRESQMFADSNGLRIVDASKPFCDAGVEPFDMVQMRGCDPSLGNAECPIGYRCFVHPNSQVAGIGACMLDDEADRLAEACKDFLTSIRRYTVGTTTTGTLQLMPRKHTLRMTPVEGCTTSEQCQTIATYQAANPSSLHPIDETATDDRTWTCEADALRPVVDTGKRCMLKCDSQDDCFPGTICQGATGTGKTGNCMEGIVPPQACINAPQQYELRVGEAFAVLGQRTGFEHATKADATGKCVRDDAISPLIAGRIKLTPEACALDSDPLTGKRPDGTFDPNPCAFTVENTDIVPLYDPGTCTLAATPAELRERQAPAIRFRNKGMTLTIVDPYYPGDQMCILDRARGLGNIPHVFTNYQIAFRQSAGFQSLLLPVTPAFPIKVVRGPTNSIWVIDEGDFLSTSINQPSTRGKVFRIEPHQLGLINVLE